MEKLEKLAASLLMWECGLKHPKVRVRGGSRKVTPYVGVWIETNSPGRECSYRQSLLMWECGLKQAKQAEYTDKRKSLLMWECGLKPSLLDICWNSTWSLLMWECGLKLNSRVDGAGLGRHSLCGSVD